MFYEGKQLTKSEEKLPEEQELREFLARRAQSLRAAEPKAAKGKLMLGLHAPEYLSFELEVSLDKLPALLNECRAQETRWVELRKMNVAVKEQTAKAETETETQSKPKPKSKSQRDRGRQWTLCSKARRRKLQASRQRRRRRASSLSEIRRNCPGQIR